MNKIYPDASVVAISLLEAMLRFDPQSRCTVDQALTHPFLAPYNTHGDEPVCTPFNFSFEDAPMDSAALQGCILEEIAGLPGSTRTCAIFAEQNPVQTYLTGSARTLDEEPASKRKCTYESAKYVEESAKYVEESAKYVEESAKYVTPSNGGLSYGVSSSALQSSLLRKQRVMASEKEKETAILGK